MNLLKIQLKVTNTNRQCDQQVFSPISTFQHSLLMIYQKVDNTWTKGLEKLTAFNKLMIFTLSWYLNTWSSKTEVRNGPKMCLL